MVAKKFVSTLKPASGFSPFFRVGLNVALALAVFVLVRIEFTQMALALVLLSKWRMFVVRPRFWPVNVRVNAVDLIVSLSMLLFMLETGDLWVQLVWAALYAVWLVLVKPRSSTLMISLQATAGLLLGLLALFYGLGDAPLYWLVLGAGMVCLFSARHFFDSFDEPYAKLLSWLYAFFAAGVVWVLGHWLLFYMNGFIAQPALLLVALGYGLGSLYYLDHFDRLSKPVRTEIMITTLIVVVAIVISLTVSTAATVRDILQ